MRTKQSIQNVKMGLIYQVIILLLNFISRKVFLDALGAEYAGLNTLFNNIITMFSLAEMGVGTAIIYNLYKPLAENNEEEIAGLMQLYKKLYMSIGLVIGLIGVCFVAVLPWFVKAEGITLSEVYGAYAVFLGGTVLTYLTGHRRSLLYADQKNYILLAGDMLIGIVGALLGIAVLMLHPSYTLYCVIYIGAKVVPNLWGAYKVNALYPYLKKDHKPLSREVMKAVRQNVRDLFIHKSSEFVVNSTDSLILSSFVGLGIVGRIGNYTLITGALMTLVAQIINGLQASMGNLVAESQKEKVQEIFECFSFMMFLLASFYLTTFMCLVQPFIKVWIGEGYVLERQLVMVIGLNFLLWILTRPLWQQLSVTGLFKEDRINALVEMSLNLVLSIVLVTKLGAIGVFIGTTCSYLIAWFLKSRLLYQKYFRMKPQRYYRMMLGYLVLGIAETGLTYSICTLLPEMHPILLMVVRVMICLVIPNLINGLLFRRNRHFTYVRQLIEELIIKMIDKLNAPKLKDGLQKGVFVILMILMFIVPLERAIDESLRPYGKLAALGIFGVTNLYILFRVFVDQETSQKFKRYILIYAGLGSLLVVISFITGKMAGVKASLMMLLMINIGMACAMIDYRRLGKWVWIVDVLSLIFLYKLLTDYLVWRSDPNRWMYLYIYNNSNYCGLVLLLICFINLLFYSYTKGERYLLYTLGLLIPMNASHTRTAMLTIIVVGVTYIIFGFIRKAKVTYYGFMVCLILGITGFTWIYPKLAEIENIKILNQAVEEESKKNLFSGREILWEKAIEYHQEEPILGYGMQVKLEELTAEDESVPKQSVHNMYLQILLQGGLVGLSLFILSLLVIWWKLYAMRNDQWGRIGASCIIGILIIGTFELTLMGESISLGSLQWLIIGMSLAMILQKYLKKDGEDERYGI